MKNDFPREQIEIELSNSSKFTLRNELGKSRVCARKAAGLALRYWFQDKGLITEAISPFKAIELFYNSIDIPPDIHQAASLLLQKVDANYHFPDNIKLIDEAQKIITFVKSQSED